MQGFDLIYFQFNLISLAFLTLKPERMFKIYFLIAILLISLNSFAQSIEPDKFPIYFGCHKKETNEDLQECFKEKLIYELQDIYQLNADFLEKEMEKNSNVRIIFRITKEGVVDNFSYSADSNPEIAKLYLRKLNTIFKEYNKKGKFIEPAIYKGKKVNYTTTINLSRS